MSKKEKLIARLLRRPTDFTFEEAVALFNMLGFTIDNKGRTSGSRVAFVKEDLQHRIHKPHDTGAFKRYAIDDMIDFLTSNNLI